MSIAALAGAAVSGLPGGGAQKVKPAFGLGFRFSVKIDSVDLGGWQTCGGLKVEFKSTEVRRGGSYLSQKYLPDKVVFSKVTLKRAVDKDSSKKLQEWLDTAARKWLSGESSTGSNATIVLYDSNEEKVLTWTLRNARPSAWTGPDLDASNSKVAIEVLELTHEGFEVESAAGKSTKGPKEKPAKQLQLKAGNKTVAFPYSPEKVKVMFKGSELKGTALQPEQGNEYLPGVTSYVISNLTLEGPRCHTDVRNLLVWATPVPKTSTGKPSSCPPTDGKESKPDEKPGGDADQPIISFTWGTAFNADVQLKTVDANYVRFSPDGQPLRADVTITLKVVKDKANSKPMIGSNPTSGGLAGRSSRIVTDSDTLPLVAREHYGDPNAWRDIAAANGIDDPLRVRPGKLLYLPANSELTRGRPA